MIAIHIVYDENHNLIGFRSSGHAGYDKYGKDIICSAVSALTVNLINSTLTLTEQGVVYETSENDGLIKLKYEQPIMPDAKLLFDACLIGLREIEDTYGSQYVHITDVHRISKNNYKIINHQEV